MIRFLEPRPLQVPLNVFPRKASFDLFYWNDCSFSAGLFLTRLVLIYGWPKIREEKGFGNGIEIFFHSICERDEPEGYRCVEIKER